MVTLRGGIMAMVLGSVIVAPSVCFADAQSDRAALIGRMTMIGVIVSHTVVGSEVQLVVGNGFSDSDYESKRAVAATVFAYHASDEAGVVTLVIRRADSGAILGRYDAQNGLVLD